MQFVPVWDSSLQLIESAAVPSWVADSLKKLPYGHSDYFEPGSAVKAMPIAALAATRTRWEAAVRASDLMLSASQGKIPKRSAISIAPIPGHDRFAIQDGNSTFIVALLSDWADIPAIVAG